MAGQVRIERVAAGDGRTYASLGDAVRVFYRGTLPDGAEFHAVQPGEDGANAPFEFEFGQDGLIPGWTNAFEDICQGEKVVVHIPAHLGYAESGYPDKDKPGGYAIPPNTDLKYEIHCVEIIKKRAKKAAPPAEPTAEELKAIEDSRAAALLASMSAGAPGSGKKGGSKKKAGAKKKGGKKRR